MIARVLVAAALVALLAGCGGSGHNASPRTTTTKPKPKPKPRTNHQMTKLVVTILDGDQRTRVRGNHQLLLACHKRTRIHNSTTKCMSHWSTDASTQTHIQFSNCCKRFHGPTSQTSSRATQHTHM